MNQKPQMRRYAEGRLVATGIYPFLVDGMKAIQVAVATVSGGTVRHYGLGTSRRDVTVSRMVFQGAGSFPINNLISLSVTYVTAV